MSALAEYRRNALAPPAELVEQHAALVRRIALHLAARLPANVDIDDLCQAGMIGLLEAARSFDPGAGASFETFAGIRIRGSMIDELRRGDWAPRSVHRRMREVAAATHAVEQTLGRDASEAEIAEFAGMTVQQYQKTLADATRCQVLSMQIDNGDDEESTIDIAGPGSDPLASLEEGDFRAALVEAVEGLPEREKLVLSLYYDDELNLKEIGAVLGVSESRVCQIHGQAVLRVKSRMVNWSGRELS